MSSGYPTKKGYFILNNSDIKLLEQDVVRFLNQGWNLAGGVAVRQGKLYQALTKEFEL